MLRRVVRRALNGRNQPKSPDPTATAVPAENGPAPSPTAAPSAPAAPTSSIAARIASHASTEHLPPVSATSGVEQAATARRNTAEDGTEFWGRTDNESARAKARGETLIIDQWECISCGTCVENTDIVFVLPDDAKAVVHQQYGDMRLIQDAIDACPVTCIHWAANPQEFEQLNDALGNPIHGQ